MSKLLSRRRFLQITAASVPSTILAACALSQPAAETPGEMSESKDMPAIEEGTITILVYNNYALERPENRTVEASIMMSFFEEYQETVRPGVKIELEEVLPQPGQAGVEIPRIRAAADTITDLVAHQAVPSLMVSDLFYQLPRETLDQPNPYSPNARWWDDFPFDGVIFSSFAGAAVGTYWGLGLTRIGGASVVGAIYNRDLFEKAGIDSADPGGDVIPPKTWAEWMDWHEKLKSIDVIPFTIGNHIAGGCCAVWTHGMIYNNLMEDHHQELQQICANFFGEEPNGMLNVRYGAYLWKTGQWTFNDEHTAAYFQILKDWSQYWQPGFMAESPEDLFLTGEAAMRYVFYLEATDFLETLKDEFKFGTFYAPPITSETWSGAPGLPQRALGSGGTPGGFGFGSVFMISQKAVREGRLPLVQDLLQWLTAPAQLERYHQQLEPRAARPDATVAEVYPDDPEKQEAYRVYYEPPAIRDGKRYGVDEMWHVSGVGNEAGFRQTIQAFMSGQLKTPEEAAAKLEEVAQAGTARAIAENPDWNADSW
jgi:ABC-type glycerol-3-phosphate transport system substrate-binding protein